MDLSVTTKEKIRDAAIMLFSDRGYETVSMRDIARIVGIRAASIYNHFPSKREILKKIYEFYAEELRKVLPSAEALVLRLETDPIQDVLDGMSYYYPPDLQDRMDRIILIGSQRICLDRDGDAFISEHFFQPLVDIWVPILSRAIELGKIQPVDIGCFTKLVTFFAFSAAELNRTSMKLTKEQWDCGMGMLFSLLKPKKD